jgi:hypothetical protein
MDALDDGIEGLMDEQLRTEAYPIFAGAVAVAKPGTLVTRDYVFIRAMADAKANIETIPERLRARVEHFDIKKGSILEVSDEADLVFRLLCNFEDKISWTDYWGYRGPGRGNGVLGSEYYMEDVDAKAYIAKEGFTPEELEWLWGMAQAMHVLSDKPVVRR